MHRPSSPFVGREPELAALLEAWEHVAAGRGPRTVVVLAESGLGKTRLAQALYVAIAAGRAATLEGERGYWPTLLGHDGNNLRVNPQLDACAPAAPMPFLWWGVRLVDPLASNQLAGGVLGWFLARATIETRGFLAPWFIHFLQDVVIFSTIVLLGGF